MGYRNEVDVGFVYLKCLFVQEIIMVQFYEAAFKEFIFSLAINKSLENSTYYVFLSETQIDP